MKVLPSARAQEAYFLLQRSTFDAEVALEHFVSLAERLKTAGPLTDAQLGVIERERERLEEAAAEASRRFEDFLDAHSDTAFRPFPPDL